MNGNEMGPKKGVFGQVTFVGDSGQGRARLGPRRARLGVHTWPEAPSRSRKRRLGLGAPVVG